jgi:hypothetical protein
MKIEVLFKEHKSGWVEVPCSRSGLAASVLRSEGESAASRPRNRISETAAKIE